MPEINELIKLYPERESQILRMYAKNHLIVKDKSGIIVSDDCLNILGEDKVNLISSFPDISSKVVGLDKKTLKLIGKLVERYQQSNASSEWTYLFQNILNNILEYEVLLGTIEEEQIDLLDSRTLDNLINIMIDENLYNISNMEQITEYQKIRSEKCKNIFESTEDFEEKIDMVLTSKYGISKKYVKDVLEKYGEDIESIKDEKLKSFIKGVSYVYNMPNNEESLKKLNAVMQNDSVASLSDSDGFNRLSLEYNLRKSYAELYIDEGLFSISDGLPVEHSSANYESVYELPFNEDGVESFGILIHNIEIGLQTGGLGEEDCYKFWNRCEMNSPHICASYIRRDCIKAGGLNFGFNNISNDDLVSISPIDSDSNNAGLVTKATDRYCSPNKLLQNTGLIGDKRGYNEIDIKRFTDRNGEIEPRQPDYIIIFKSDGNISKMDIAQKVSEDFEKHTGMRLPILVIDEDKCRETEILKFVKMQLQYEKEPTEELENQINDTKQMLIKEYGEIDYILKSFCTSNLIEDSIEAYKISLMQIELEKNPSNDELRDKIENLKQAYIKKLIVEKRPATGIRIEVDRDSEMEEQSEEWSEEEIDTDNTNEFSNEELENWDGSYSGDSWEDEINEDEIIDSFNKLIREKYLTIKEYSEKSKTIEVSEIFLTNEKAKQIARSEGVPFKKEFGREDFSELENTPEINREVKSFE